MNTLAPTLLRNTLSAHMLWITLVVSASSLAACGGAPAPQAPHSLPPQTADEAAQENPDGDTLQGELHTHEHGPVTCEEPEHALVIAAPEPYPTEREPAVGDILHVPTGFFVTAEQMFDVMTDARVVYIGETHDNPASHRLEVDVLRAMWEAHPDGVALGMEMFTPAHQATLDSWVGGTLSEREFLEEVAWFDHWKMDYALYRDLLAFARDKAIPVIGLNAEKHMVRALVMKSVEELDPEEREAVPEMDMNDPYQRAMVEAVYGDHSHGHGSSDGFQRVQTLWDETMASNVAAYLTSDVGRERRMVVVAGGHHVRHGFGIPRRVFRRVPVSYVLAGTEEIVIPESKLDSLMDVDLAPFPMPPYDFVQHVVYEELQGPPAKLGALIGEGMGGVSVTSVMPGSPAANAGIIPGDLIVAVAGHEVVRPFDLIYEVKRFYRDEETTVTILRDGTRLDVVVTFTEVPEHGMEHGADGATDPSDDVAPGGEDVPEE